MDLEDRMTNYNKCRGGQGEDVMAAHALAFLERGMF